MYKELGGHHNEPHIHIKYNEYTMSITIDGKVLSGRLPNKQRKLLEAWMILHGWDSLMHAFGAIFMLEAYSMLFMVLWEKCIIRWGK